MIATKARESYIQENTLEFRIKAETKRDAIVIAMRYLAPYMEEVRKTAEKFSVFVTDIELSVGNLATQFSPKNKSFGDVSYTAFVEFRFDYETEYEAEAEKVLDYVAKATIYDGHKENIADSIEWRGHAWGELISSSDDNSDLTFD